MEEEQNRQQKVSFKILYLIHLECAPLKDRIDSKIREILSNKNRALSFKAIMQGYSRRIGSYGSII